MAESSPDGAPVALAPEALARALFEQSPFSCVIYDVEGRPLAVNAAFTRLMGLTLADVPADYTVLRDAQLEALGMLPLVRRVFAGEPVTLPPIRYDARMHADTGLATWTQGHFYPIRNDDGHVVQVVLVHHDLTARMHAEEALRDSEAELKDARLRLEAILNAVGDGITVQDKDGRIVYANAAGARLSGFDDVKEFLATPLEQVRARFAMRDEQGNAFHRDRLPGRRALDGEKDPEALINYVVLATGEEHWTVVRARAITNEQNVPMLVVNAFHDVTERMQHQRAIEENAARLAHTLEQLRARTAEAEVAREAAVWAEERARFLADSGRLLASSMDYETTLRTLVHLSVPRIADWCALHLIDDAGQVRRLEVAHADPARLDAARHLEQMYPPDPDTSGVFRVVRTGKAELYPDITDAMIVQSAVDDEHLRQVRALGLRSAMIVPLTAHGRTYGALTLIAAESGRCYDTQDLTFVESLASRAALAMHNTMLYREAREANLAKSKFLAVMSHELRTPLNAILGYADLLSAGIGGTLSPRQEEQLARIRQSTQHLTELIETILAFARVDAGKEQVRAQSCDIAELTREAVALMLPAADKKELTLVVDAQPATLHTDPAKVRQILLNLLSNAVKFTERGAVRVRTARAGEFVEVAVTDSGAGIAADQLARIWEPFTQLDSELTRTAGGTGLGLPVSASLARLLGGTIAAVSSPGNGSTFTLRLPVNLQAE